LISTDFSGTLRQTFDFLPHTLIKDWKETTMKNWMKVLSLGGILLSAAVVQAQPAAAPVPAPAVDTTVTTTTTTDTAGTPGSTVIGAENYGTMPTTGGAPIAMALGGMLTAASAFFVRRKVS
jgi:hypothetical protein